MFFMIPGLDGLRAIAFLLVFALHTNYLQIGWVGVSLFFVLSGFLITGILLDMKKALASNQYFLKFYGRRFLRIFPLYYFYLLLVVLITTWLISLPYRPRYMHTALDQIKYAFLYVYDFFFATDAFKTSNFLDHTWSLSVEEQFYIIWPFLILRVPEKYLKKLFLGFIIAGPVFRLGLYALHASGMFSFLSDNPAQAIYPLPFSHMDAFAFGVYISRFAIPHARKQFLTLLVLIPVIGFGAQYLSTGEIGAISALGYPLQMPNSLQFVWGYTLLNYFFAILIYGVAREGWFVRLLEIRPARYLGKISYGMYVYHFPIIWFVARMADLGIKDPYLKPLTALVAFIATLGLASLSYSWLERPILNFKGSLLYIQEIRKAGRYTPGNGGFMISRLKKNLSWERVVIALLFLAGILLRLRQYLTGRSLWVDEAMLALNIVNRNFMQLFQPLDYDQGAPLGFLLIEKLFNLLLGRSEYALRFFPLLLGMLSIWLFYLLLKRVTTGMGLIAALALFVFNPRLIYYSSEVKQYIVDVVATLALLLLAAPLLDLDFRKRNLTWLAVAGFFALWLSHPAVFVLAGIGLTLAVLCLERRDIANFWYVLGLGIFWLATLGLLYLLILNDLRQNAYMQEYWQGAFLPLPPWSDLGWFRGSLTANIGVQFGIPYAVYFVFVLMLAGWFVLWQTKCSYAIALGSTLLITLLASAFKLYPVMERMILFLIPIGLILMGASVEFIERRLQNPRWLGGTIALALTGFLIFGPFVTSSGYFLKPKYYEHIRPSMGVLQESWRPGDALYVSYGALPAFEFYAPVYGLSGVDYLSNAREDYQAPEKIARQLNSLNGKSRVWILLSHVYEQGDFNEKDFIINDLQNNGRLKREFRVPGTSVYLYLFDLRK